ncbi:hypothetical protein GDO81_003648 [Engystomops pustulosus]|uniref:Uncharacterized protein n=1 Tax=Engystomops pustulosus TaxID=76066 RepID=A0AAV7A2L9_ENGPU|nr:hypothetical protein GDO81_003648 [Engystomops pustulosus]
MRCMSPALTQQRYNIKHNLMGHIQLVYWLKTSLGKSNREREHLIILSERSRAVAPFILYGLPRMLITLWKDDELKSWPKLHTFRYKRQQIKSHSNTSGKLKAT